MSSSCDLHPNVASGKLGTGEAGETQVHTADPRAEQSPPSSDHADMSGPPTWLPRLTMPPFVFTPLLPQLNRVKMLDQNFLRLDDE